MKRYAKTGNEKDEEAMRAMNYSFFVTETGKPHKQEPCGQSVLGCVFMSVNIHRSG